MAMLFVDGAIRKVEVAEGEPAVREGGVGIVLASPNSTRGTICGFGQYFAPSTKVTNQRMELQAIHLGVEFAKRCGVGGEPLHIWSDSMYALKTLGPSDWNPTKNLDLIVPIQRSLRSVDIAGMQHVRSHIDRKSSGRLPDMTLHEMADAIAQEVVEGRTHKHYEVGRGPRFSPGCLACQRFPCKDENPLVTLRLSEHGEPCGDFLGWPEMAIKGYSREEVEAAWPTTKT